MKNHSITIMLCCLLALGASAVAQSTQPESGGGHCSSRTLSGTYGYSAQGQVLPVPGLAFLFSSTGVATFDGISNVSWLEHTVVGGEQQGIDWTPSTGGTYIVNPDCTGKMVVVTPNSREPLHIFISLVQQGKQFYSVVNGNAITGVWTRLK